MTTGSKSKERGGGASSTSHSPSDSEKYSKSNNNWFNLESENKKESLIVSSTISNGSIEEDWNHKNSIIVGRGSINTMNINHENSIDTQNDAISSSMTQ